MIITQTSCQFKVEVQKGGFIFDKVVSNIDFTTVKNDGILLHKHIKDTTVIQIYRKNYNFQ